MVSVPVLDSSAGQLKQRTATRRRARPPSSSSLFEKGRGEMTRRFSSPQEGFGRREEIEDGGGMNG